MPLGLFILSLTAAASSPPAAQELHHYGRPFVSPMGEPFHALAGMDALQSWFAQADRNHDNILTVEEMEADADRFFATLDSDHDGEIGPDEITRYEEDIAPRAQAGLLDLPEPITAADTDFNRGVSLDEFRKAAVLRFQALDVDHQGQLTVALLESLHPAAPRREKNDTPVGEDAEALPPE